MAKCTCPMNIESTSQLCAGCESDYLKYLDELDTKEATPSSHFDQREEGQPATLAEMLQLENLISNQISGLDIRTHELTNRLNRTEQRQEAFKAALLEIARTVHNIGTANAMIDQALASSRRKSA